MSVVLKIVCVACSMLLGAVFGGVAHSDWRFPNLYAELDSKGSYLVLAECVSVDTEPKFEDFYIFDAEINDKQLKLAQSKTPHPDLTVRYELGGRYLLSVDESRDVPVGFVAVPFMAKDERVYVPKRWEIFSKETGGKYVIDSEWVPIEDIFYTRERRRAEVGKEEK